ncbi:hypothetical protein ANOM_002027 [Aspergillus nomiae NRRL 13137]|uniref:Uncharacterized protein n=1 Tax=Aspergillus nomiae NRRL (strain ATCC 15546 / NRRL 13137 / CBS 260.88 / M93) TaxID=1509407 RepID=A0A0L1JES5_ASPN3|nr:uncharacterized protein ANOM_002027 [Aspergillus nomiae NRRL 13137]KNG90236.1 hypothetical protein ANOM_002027 [Aspergillus nomiae NRRL 13137]
MEALDDKDIEAAQTLVMLSTPSRGQGSSHGQRASAIEPRSGSHPKGSMQSSTPHARQSIDPTTNTSMHSSISNPAQPVRRSSFSSIPVPAQISTDTMTASDKALQAYLLRQQLLAGIAPENLIPMRPPTTGQTQGGNQGIVNRPNNPSLVQITNNGISIPHIPPARFTGVLHPLPAQPTQGSRSPISLQRQPISRCGSNPGAGLRTQPAAQVRSENSQGRNTVSHEGSSASGGRQSEPHASERPRQPSEGDRIRRAEARRPTQRNSHLAVPHQQDRSQPRLQLFPTLARGSISPLPLNSNTISPDTSNKSSNTTGLPHNGFDILLAFTYHQGLALEFTMYLNVEELINLLSISKPFNRFVKRNCFDIIKRQATRDAPESSQIFPFRCYSRLCIDNTNARRQPIPARDIVGENDLAPSFCWLQMIIYREKTVKKIMENMLVAGYGLPKPCEPVIKKLWFIMDIPDNRRREWTMMNRNLWQDIELFFAMIFIAQLDMLLRKKRESITGRLYHLLMAQPTMTVLWDVLRDAALRSEFETLKYFVRWKYNPLPHETDLYVYGVPPQEVGALQYEGYGRHERVTKFIQPDELILREMARRQLNLGDMYQDIFLTGNRARYYSRFSQAATSWDEEMKREAGAQGIDWQNVVRLN